MANASHRGKFTFLFTPDFPAVRDDIEYSTISNLMDPLIQLAAVARETTHIGSVTNGSTTFQEPFNTARQFKALDVMSHGRAGWNGVTTSDPTVAANYGRPAADRDERYQRAHEAIQIVQALWGSWQQDAWVKDQATGRFIARPSCDRSTCKTSTSLREAPWGSPVGAGPARHLHRRRPQPALAFPGRSA